MEPLVAYLHYLAIVLISGFLVAEMVVCRPSLEAELASSLFDDYALVEQELTINDHHRMLTELFHWQPPDLRQYRKVCARRCEYSTTRCSPMLRSNCLRPNEKPTTRKKLPPVRHPGSKRCGTRDGVPVSGGLRIWRSSRAAINESC